VFEAFTQADGSLKRRYGGAGLGLTIAARLVAAMGGRLWAESEVGLGSTFHFTVRFAKAEAPAGTELPLDGALEARPEARASRPLRVILADDNPVNVRVATHLLEEWGHSVVTAADGREALGALTRERFDLALLDLQMPEMTGLELTAALRDRERAHGGHLPVIALTAHSLPADRERCLAAGMDGYVSKPVEAATLFQAIEAATRSTPGPGAPAAARPTLDLPAALSRFGGDAKLFREVAQVFLEDWPRLHGDLRAAVDRRDPAALRAAAHAIKGTVAVFAAAAAVEAAARLENVGTRADFAALEARARSLETEVARLRAELQAAVDASS
jgi:CheY-like chemotaxis protein/HPt (histidine-containing phosphotransfer) domain-containing protein